MEVDHRPVVSLRVFAKNATLDVVVDMVGVCLGWIRMSRVRGGDSLFKGLMGGPSMAGALDRPRSVDLGGGREAALFEAGFVSVAAMAHALALLDLDRF